MTDRLHPTSVEGEILNLLLDQAKRTNALLGELRDRLPAASPVAVGEPERIQIREPAAPAKAASTPLAEPSPAPPRRRGRPPKPREN